MSCQFQWQGIYLALQFIASFSCLLCFMLLLLLGISLLKELICFCSLQTLNEILKSGDRSKAREAFLAEVSRGFSSFSYVVILPRFVLFNQLCRFIIILFHFINVLCIYICTSILSEWIQLVAVTFLISGGLNCLRENWLFIKR